MEENKKLVFGNKEFVAELWPGDDRNAPVVELEIDAFHTHYDRDYSTETPIKGRYDLSMDEAKKLHAFLEQVTGVVEYEYTTKPHHIKDNGLVVASRTHDDWGTLEQAQRDLKGYQGDELARMKRNDNDRARWLYTIVKRRKAGEVEDV